MWVTGVHCAASLASALYIVLAYLQQLPLCGSLCCPALQENVCNLLTCYRHCCLSFDREMKETDNSVLTITKAEEGQQVAAAAAESKAAPTAMGPSVSLAARSDILEQKSFESFEMKYAKTVELNNGRAAMLGFLSACLVEAATGKGIILQVIMYLKLVGLLGAESGF